MPEQPHEPSDKKIHIDEDWKSKVGAEREQAAHEPTPETEPASEAKPTPETAAEPPVAPLPPPTLTLLATTLGMQAMAALGLMPDPATGKPQARLSYARHLIDLLQMLQDKTAGNRTSEESDVLEHLLHELRMGYVAMSQHGPVA